jgi:hypothetical protein
MSSSVMSSIEKLFTFVLNISFIDLHFDNYLHESFALQRISSISISSIKLPLTICSNFFTCSLHFISSCSQKSFEKDGDANLLLMFMYLITFIINYV